MVVVVAPPLSVGQERQDDVLSWVFGIASELGLDARRLWEPFCTINMEDK